MELFADALRALHDNGKGYIRAIPHIDNTSVYASSIMRKVVSRFSFEAELNNVREAIPLVIGTRRFMVAQLYSIGALKVWQNNMSTVVFVGKGDSTSHRTKHTAARYFFIS